MVILNSTHPVGFLDTGQKHSSVLHICPILSCSHAQCPIVRRAQSYPIPNTCSGQHQLQASHPMFKCCVLHATLVWKHQIHIGGEPMTNPYPESRTVFQPTHLRPFSMRGQAMPLVSKCFSKGLCQMTQSQICP